ncbi:diaminobutyrate acetyltransferase [Pseudalkalibacillus sp. R45]|uniref:diaminobutyrate acetyltransferase n=1 Tax=Pseudalkalibacillus sp. R45 TaxID=3457433 RepID=UPI003FCC8128
MITETVQTLDEIIFSKPALEDGKSMWQIVNDTSLDQNSSYKYIMMSEFFSETCVVAKINDQTVGFVTAFIPPEQPEVVFVWQIGVDPNERGKGIASKMLTELINRPICNDVRYLEATVTPSNQASRSLFEGFARHQDTECEITERFADDLFPSDDHESELNFRIGPFKR